MATIFGTEDNDHDDLGGKSLIGTNSADQIYGYAGNDLIDGRGGNDYLVAGSGFDTILGGAGNDIVAAWHGRGWLDGGPGNDTIDFSGNDSRGIFDLAAGTGRFGPLITTFTMRNFENIKAGDGNDYITGTAGSNLVYAGGGNDTVNAGAGNDTVYGDDGDDQIDGGAGNDSLYGGAGDDIMLGGAGNDLIADGPGNDAVGGGAGNDFFVDGSGNDDIHGQDGFDTVSYANTPNSVYADVPMATVHHYDSNYVDQIYSIEKVIGSSFADYLVAGATTELDGSGGDDFIYSGSGANKLTGGAGDDWLRYTFSTGAVTVNLGTSKASGGWAKGDKIAGFEDLEGSSFGDTLTGSSGSNGIVGGGGNDTINGGGGADRLFGGDGQDELRGGSGNDIIVGGAGKDSLWGGSGADRFVFEALSDSLPAVQRDVIRDFSRGQGDKIDLAAVYGPTLAFIGKAAFSAAGQVRFVQSGGNTVVEVNTAGNSGAEMAIQLTGTINLQASDFLL